MSRAASLFTAIFVAGCVASGEYAWVPLPGTTVSYDRAEARCDYETSAATQGTDYNYRSVLGQELDRALRKRDLADKCMRAQGFQKISVSAVVVASPPADPRWKILEDDWAASKHRRQQLRDKLTGDPSAPDAADTRADIQSLNVKVRELERKLSYAATVPMSTD